MHLEIGQILRKLRKAHHLSQQKVADLLFISRPTYFRYERNLVETPLSKLFELATIYGFDIIDLIKLIDETTPRCQESRILDEQKFILNGERQIANSCA